MHQTERTPRTYRHRGYVIEALPCGPHRWNIWRPRADLALCGVQSLAEAREVLAAIDRGLICAVFSLKCACSAPFRAFFSMAWSSCSGLLFAEIRCTAALFPVFQPAAALFCFNPRDPLRLLGLSFLAGPSWAPADPLFAENRWAAASALSLIDDPSVSEDLCPHSRPELERLAAGGLLSPELQARVNAVLQRYRENDQQAAQAAPLPVVGS